MPDSGFAFLDGPASEVAPRLLGCELIRNAGGDSMVVKIVETEAYDQTDVASHSYKGQTPRTEVMFGPAGRLYVYFTYGMHYCCNIVVGTPGHGAAVLVRAAEIMSGERAIVKRRHGLSGPQLTNGPAKLCQALNIDKSLNGHNLKEAPLVLKIRPALMPEQIVATTRIGLSKGKDVPWRFFVRGNAFVSKPNE